MSADVVILGLGSNLNHPIANLRKALSELKKLESVQVLDVAPIYESDAQVPEGAPSEWDKKYLNSAVLLKVHNLKPAELLAMVKNIEQNLGRSNLEKWAPRNIDIDILYWHGLKISEPELTLPHSRLTERPFALLPLLDLFPCAQVVVPTWASPWISEKPFQTRKSKLHFWPKLMGIVNLTDDSFSDGGLYQSEESIESRIQNLISAGAEIIDLGAESTRPNAKPIDFETEIKRLSLALSLTPKFRNNVQISIDSFKPAVIEYCLNNFEIDLINDVNGLRDQKMIQLVKQSGKTAVVMHSLSVPANANESIPVNEDPIQHLQNWWQQKSTSLFQAGLKQDQIIFDPGIGFGKTKEQSVYILRSLEKFGMTNPVRQDIFIGHSRKSFLSLFSNKAAENRDLETALITKDLNLAYTQYLRLHDIESQLIPLRMK